VLGVIEGTPAAMSLQLNPSMPHISFLPSGNHMPQIFGLPHTIFFFRLFGV